MLASRSNAPVWQRVATGIADTSIRQGIILTGKRGFEMSAEIHLPRAIPLAENEYATGALYGLLTNILEDADQASRITAAIERLIDAKLAAAFRKDAIDD
jgi:hypothetical protein